MKKNRKIKKVPFFSDAKKMEGKGKKQSTKTIESGRKEKQEENMPSQEKDDQTASKQHGKKKKEKIKTGKQPKHRINSK